MYPDPLDALFDRPPPFDRLGWWRSRQSLFNRRVIATHLVVCFLLACYALILLGIWAVSGLIVFLLIGIVMLLTLLVVANVIYYLGYLIDRLALYDANQRARVLLFECFTVLFAAGPWALVAIEYVRQ